MGQRPSAAQTRALIASFSAALSPLVIFTGVLPRERVPAERVPAERSGHAQAAWPPWNHVAIHFLVESARIYSSVRLAMANQRKKTK